METSALNASNVETAFTTLVGNIYQKKKQTSVPRGPSNEPIQRGVGRTIPVVSNPIDETNVGQNSFHLKYESEDDEDEDSKKKSGGCCKTN